MNLHHKKALSDKEGKILKILGTRKLYLRKMITAITVRGVSFPGWSRFFLICSNWTAGAFLKIHKGTKSIFVFFTQPQKIIVNLIVKSFYRSTYLTLRPFPVFFITLSSSNLEISSTAARLEMSNILRMSLLVICFRGFLPLLSTAWLFPYLLQFLRGDFRTPDAALQLPLEFLYFCNGDPPSRQPDLHLLFR